MTSTITCENCGVICAASRTIARYCSETCRKRAETRRYRAKRKASRPVTLRPCAVCGASVKVEPKRGRPPARLVCDGCRGWAPLQTCTDRPSTPD